MEPRRGPREAAEAVGRAAQEAADRGNSEPCDLEPGVLAEFDLTGATEAGGAPRGPLSRALGRFVEWVARHV